MPAVKHDLTKQPKWVQDVVRSLQEENARLSAIVARCTCGLDWTHDVYYDTVLRYGYDPLERQPIPALGPEPGHVLVDVTGRPEYTVTAKGSP